MIYLDNAATTSPFPEVREAMLPFLGPEYGNPSAAYELGEESRNAVEQARIMVARTLYTKPENIYFTSGGTEADNWALRFAASWERQNGDNNHHIITSAIEHHAILHTCDALEKEGVRISRIPVSRDGVINLEALERAIAADTVMISVMLANNEIGTIQPVDRIAAIAHQYGLLFHTDAVQAYGQIPISPEQTGIDLMSASGHKFNGPKGIGFLYAREGLDLRPMIYGGAQEKNMRAGTENVPGITGLGRAAWISHQIMRRKMQRETYLRNYLDRKSVV